MKPAHVKNSSKSGVISNNFSMDIAYHISHAVRKQVMEYRRLSNVYVDEFYRLSDRELFYQWQTVLEKAR